MKLFLMAFLFSLLGLFSKAFCGGYEPAVLGILAYIVCILNKRS